MTRPFMKRSRHQTLRIALLFGVSIGAVWAEESHLKLKAETSLSFDSNLFRLPSGTDPTLAIGGTSLSSEIGVTSLTLAFSTAMSLQRLELAVALVDYRYRNFDYLNYTSYNYNAALQWSLTPALHGNLNSLRKETANSFSDYLGLKQSNLRTETSNQLDMVYEVDGPWRISAGVSKYSQTNQQALVAGGDYTRHALETGIAYVFGTGSNISFKQKSADGQYLNRVLIAGTSFDTHFAQNISDVRVHWAISNESNADFFLSYFNQTHPNVPQRDFSGLNSGASLNWALTKKSSINIAQSREISAYATNNANYSQTDRLSLGPTWQISPKSLARFRQEWARIIYLGSPGTLTLVQRSDFTRDTTLAFFWQPDQKLSFSAALQNAARASSQSGLDYESKQFSVTAQYSY